MRNICFYFQVHQPFRLRSYRFFDIQRSHDYFDEHKNRTIMRKVAEKCYLPTNRILLELIRKYEGDFKVSFSISGIALEQFELYAPEVLDSFQSLAETGCVEFLAETYAHSLSALKSSDEFSRQVKEHGKKIKSVFGLKPSVFRNTELIYSNHIGNMVSEMGFKAMLSEGAAHILGWRSPNFLYCNAQNPRLKLLLKNYQLSDDIAFRFSQKSWNGWPLTADKYVHWLNAIPESDEIINLFMDYETFGEHQWEDTGIFEFLKALPGKVFNNSPYAFVTPSEAVESLTPVASLDIPYPVSWADMERDLSAWLSNELQHDAFDSLYELEEKVMQSGDEQIAQDWLRLQTSDNLYYMCTKYFSDGDVHKYFNPYDSPYDAYINFMNVLCDFQKRLEVPFRRNRVGRIRGRKVRGLPQAVPVKELNTLLAV